MLCKECPFFEIQAEPEMPWQMGLAVCKKYNLYTDFIDHRKINRLKCVEVEAEEGET